MGKIMAIDYGKKRCGIAVTDDMQIIASGLETIETSDIFEFLKKYFVENQVDSIVVGPVSYTHLDVYKRQRLE